MSYWENITEIYRKQREKGIATYGQTLEDNVELDAVETLTMAQEELIDLLMYLEHTKEKLRVDNKGLN